MRPRQLAAAFLSLLPSIYHSYAPITMNENQTGNFKRLTSIVFRYLTLQLDYAKLTATEKLTVLLSTIAFFALILILGLITLVFISIGIGHLLASTVAPYTAYLYVSAFYLVLLVLLIVFRNQIIFNPVSRFLSRLFLKNPEDDHEE